MKKLIKAFVGIFFFILGQNVLSQDRIHLGENTIVRKLLETESIFSDAIVYIEQQGYSGDYDAMFFNPSNPFPSVKLVAPGAISTREAEKEDHIISQDKNLLIWLDYGNTSDYMERLAVKFGKSVGDMRKQVSYMPQEYARTVFNADTVLIYSMDMEGKKLNEKYKYHKAILMYNKQHKTYLLLHCFLTDEGLKDFDNKYLKDIEKMFCFKDMESLK